METPVFNLMSRNELFRQVWRGDYFGIECVKGITLNGRYQTFARVVDVVFQPAKGA